MTERAVTAHADAAGPNAPVNSDLRAGAWPVLALGGAGPNHPAPYTVAAAAALPAALAIPPVKGVH